VATISMISFVFPEIRGAGRAPGAPPMDSRLPIHSLCCILCRCMASAKPERLMVTVVFKTSSVDQIIHFARRVRPPARATLSIASLRFFLFSI